MTLTAQVLAGLMALTLIVVGALETFFFRSAALYPIFLIEPGEYDAVALWTRNVGVYNMLMGIATVIGIALVRRGQVAAGRALVLAFGGMHVVLGLTLLLTAPELWLSALSESGLALAVVVAVLAGDRRADRERHRTDASRAT